VTPTETVRVSHSDASSVPLPKRQSESENATRDASSAPRPQSSEPAPSIETSNKPGISLKTSTSRFYTFHDMAFCGQAPADIGLSYQATMSKDSEGLQALLNQGRIRTLNPGTTVDSTSKVLEIVTTDSKTPILLSEILITSGSYIGERCWILTRMLEVGAVEEK
jgi:hypothetical protein